MNNRCTGRLRGASLIVSQAFRAEKTIAPNRRIPAAKKDSAVTLKGALDSGARANEGNMGLRRHIPQ